MRRPIKWLVACVALFFVLLAAAIVQLTSSFTNHYNEELASCQANQNAFSVASHKVDVTLGPHANAYFSTFRADPAIYNHQLENVGKIISIGKQRGADKLQIAIALGVAMQESHIQNLDHGHADSHGIWQQQYTVLGGDGRPYWGTLEQTRNVDFSTNRFYTELFNKVPEYKSLSMIQSAIRVQNPDPSAYFRTWKWDLVAQELAGSESTTIFGDTKAPQILLTNLADCANGPQTNVSVALTQMQTLVGKPYSEVIGNNTPADAAVVDDGSKLVQHVYANSEVALPDSAKEQFETGKKIDKTDLKPGDAVYWADNPSDPNTINQVGLWAGDGQVIEAPAANEPIRVAPMDWGKFAGATRPITDTKPVMSTVNESKNGWHTPITDPYQKSSGYGWRVNPVTGISELHNGVDLAAPAGTTIHSVCEGEVTSTPWQSTGGNVTFIRCNDGHTIGYGHQASRASHIKANVTVKVGEIIGYVGTTGGSTGNHLHLLIMPPGTHGETFVDPEPFMREHGIIL